MHLQVFKVHDLLLFTSINYERPLAVSRPTAYCLQFCVVHFNDKARNVIEMNIIVTHMREFIYTCPRELRKIVLMVLPAVSMPAYKQFQLLTRQKPTEVIERAFITLDHLLLIKEWYSARTNAVYAVIKFNRSFALKRISVNFC